MLCSGYTFAIYFLPVPGKYGAQMLSKVKCTVWIRDGLCYDLVPFHPSRQCIYCAYFETSLNLIEFVFIILIFNIIFVGFTIENVSEMKFIWLYFYLRWSPMNVSSITAFSIIPDWITFDFLKYERRWSYWRAEPISNDRPIIPELNLALRLWKSFTLEVKTASLSSRASPACTWHRCKKYP